MHRMQLQWISWGVTFLCGGTVALADNNHIRQWNPNLWQYEGTKYEIYQDEHKIVIMEDSTEIFKFEAYDLNTYEPGEIWSIETDTDGAGLVMLMVAGDSTQGRSWGAREVWKIDLRAKSASQLNTLLVKGNVGHPSHPSWIDVDSIGGYFTAYGDLYAPISADDSTSVMYIGGTTHAPIDISGPMTGSFTVAGNLLSSVSGGTLAEIIVHGAGPHTGNISAPDHPYYGTLQVHGRYEGSLSLASSYGPLTFYDDLAGQVSLPFGLVGPSGALTVQGTASHTIAIGGSAVTAISGAVTVGDLSGSLTLGSPMYACNATGLITVTDDLAGSIAVHGELSGQIRIDGSLLNGPETNDIQVGSMAPSAAIVVDYDGWDEADDWDSGAIVRVGSTSYTGNTPAASYSA